MSIYKNAIDSITIGVEDYKMAVDGDTKRYISSTRNIFAGILLLFKHKLSELSPSDSDEVLIKQYVRPRIVLEGTLEWVGKGKKTVDVQGIEDRFKDLGIEADWKALKKINMYRNNIEHYYSNESEDSVKGMLSNSFVVVRDFLVNELDMVPKDELGEEIWTYLIDINEVYTAEKNECKLKLAEIDWQIDEALDLVINHACEKCASNLISVNDNDEIYCKSCNNEYMQKDIIEKALNDAYFVSWKDISQGDEPSIATCPDCDSETYLKHECICYLCGVSYSASCASCGNDMTGDEPDGSNTCYHCQYMYEKMMEE